jgi:hypothetical protein
MARESDWLLINPTQTSIWRVDRAYRGIKLEHPMPVLPGILYIALRSNDHHLHIVVHDAPATSNITISIIGTVI